MLFSALFGRGLLTMLAPDPEYEAWTAEEGLNGETDFHIADSPFLYTRGWDFVGVSFSVVFPLCFRIICIII
jgi:hypothetical protein